MVARFVMRTTLDLPIALIQEATELTHIRTKTALIVTALEEMIRKRKLRKLKAYKGRIPLDINLDALRKRG